MVFKRYFCAPKCGLREKKGFQAVFFAPKYGLREKNGFQAVFFAPKYGLREKKCFQAVTRPNPFYCLPAAHFHIKESLLQQAFVLF